MLVLLRFDGDALCNDSHLSDYKKGQNRIYFWHFFLRLQIGRTTHDGQPPKKRLLSYLILHCNLLCQLYWTIEHTTSWRFAPLSIVLDDSIEDIRTTLWQWEFNTHGQPVAKHGSSLSVLLLQKEAAKNKHIKNHQQALIHASQKCKKNILLLR